MRNSYSIRISNTACGPFLLRSAEHRPCLMGGQSGRSTQMQLQVDTVSDPRAILAR